MLNYGGHASKIEVESGYERLHSQTDEHVSVRINPADSGQRVFKTEKIISLFFFFISYQKNKMTVCTRTGIDTVKFPIPH